MRKVGIEAMNVDVGLVTLDVAMLAQHRGLDVRRFENLLVDAKTVALPDEDPVTFAINAATPILNRLSDAERSRIDLVITCTESGLDFGKSLSTYIQRYGGLGRHCRLFELKQACYSGVAGLQMAANYVLSEVSPSSKALVIATDVSRFSASGIGGEWGFSEPVAGSGAVAYLVSADPAVLSLDIGASGFYSFEVMDTCRPSADGAGAGDADLSLMSYMDCLDAAYLNYEERVHGVDLRASFDYLAFHAPFGGLVRGAHRKLMRERASAGPPEIDADFYQRVVPGLEYGRRVGNLLGGSVLLSIISTIEHGDLLGPARLGCFAYGSGCCSEFFSAVADEASKAVLAEMRINERLVARRPLDMREYTTLLDERNIIPFGARHAEPATDLLAASIAKQLGTQPRFVLKGVHDFHRQYEWA